MYPQGSKIEAKELRIDLLVEAFASTSKLDMVKESRIGSNTKPNTLNYSSIFTMESGESTKLVAVSKLEFHSRSKNPPSSMTSYRSEQAF